MHCIFVFCGFICVEGSFYVSFSKKEVGPNAPQNGLQSTILPLSGCAQTLSPSLREDAAKWAYPLDRGPTSLVLAGYRLVVPQPFCVCLPRRFYRSRLALFCSAAWLSYFFTCFLLCFVISFSLTLPSRVSCS